MATNIKGDLSVSGNILVQGTVDGVDVSGHAADSAIHHTHANKTNLDAVNQNVGSAGNPAFAGLTVNGDVAVTGKVDGVDVSVHAADSAIHHAHTNKGNLDSVDQKLGMANAPAFAGMTVNGNVAVTGTVDGVDVSAHAADTSIHNLAANKVYLDTINQNLGTANLPAFAGLTVNGDVAVTGKVDGVDVSVHAADSAIHHAHTNKGNLDSVDQKLGMANAPAFAGMTVNGNVAVTGTVDGVDVSDHAANSAIHHTHANKTNLDAVNQNVGSAGTPAFAGMTVNGDVAVTGKVDGVDVSVHAADITIHHAHTNKGNLDSVDQKLGIANVPAFAGMTVNGNVAVTGTVDGVDVSAHAADTSIHNLAANKVYLDTINQNLGTANLPAFAGLTVNGDVAVTGKVDGVDVSVHAADITIHHAHTNKGNLDSVDQKLGMANAPAFAGMTVNGNVVVTGTVDGVDVSDHAADSAIHHTHANKTNLDAVNQNVGSAGNPAFAGLTVTGDVAVTGKVDGVDVSVHAADSAIHHAHTNKGNLDSVDQKLGMANAPAFAGMTVNGNVAVTGTVDGVDVSAHAADTSIHNLAANKVYLDTINQNLGTANLPAFAGMTVNGDVAVTGKVDGVDVSVHAADSAIHHAHTNKGNLDSVDQKLGMANAPAFAGMTVNGNVAVTGTVDGVDVSAHAADTSIHNLAANKVYLDTINQNLGTANLPAFAGLTVNGDVAVTGKVDGVDVSVHAADITIHHAHTNKGNLDSVDQKLGMANAPAFAGMTVNGNVVVTGTVDGVDVSDHAANSAIHHTHANKTNLDAVNQNVGSAGTPAFAGLTVTGDVAVTGKVDGVDVSVHAADSAIHHAHTNKGNLDSVDQKLGMANAPAFAGMTVNGNVAITGTVDGVDVSVHAANGAIHHTHANKTNLDAVNQNVGSAGTPAFAGLTVNGDIAVTGTLDGVDVSTHATRHQSRGADALTGSLDANARVQVKVSDILVGTRRALNLMSGDNIILAVMDDAANESVDVTISAVGANSTNQSPETVTGVAGEAMVAYDLCYLGSDGRYYRTNSLSPTTLPGLVLAGADLRADQEGSFIRRGQVTNSNWSWRTVGGFLYACDTPGYITQFRPYISGEQRQILGIAKSATEIDFEPQLILMEVP